MNEKLENELVHYFSAVRGHAILRPEGLVSQHFPDTFAASAYHASVVRAAQEGPRGDRYDHGVGVEWCFRHVDLEKVGVSPIHCSSFRMLVYFDVSTPTERDDGLRASTIEKFVDCVSRVGLDPQRILVTYFGGGTAAGVDVPADDTVAAFWRAHGVDTAVAIAGEANFTNVHRVGEPAGPRCEVFYGHPNFPHPIEIGTVVFERYLLGKTLAGARGFVYGGAIGVERLAMLKENATSIYECSLLNDAVHAVMEEVGMQRSHLVRPDVLRIVDALRSLSVIMAASPGALLKGKRRERMKRIASIARKSFQAVGVVEEEKVERTVTRVIGALDLYELKSVHPAHELASAVLHLLRESFGVV